MVDISIVDRFIKQLVSGTGLGIKNHVDEINWDLLCRVRLVKLVNKTNYIGASLVGISVYLTEYYNIYMKYVVI